MNNPNPKFNEIESKNYKISKIILGLFFSYCVFAFFYYDGDINSIFPPSLTPCNCAKAAALDDSETYDKCLEKMSEMSFSEQSKFQNDMVECTMKAYSN